MSNENGNSNQRNGHAPTNGVFKNGNGNHAIDTIPGHDLLWDSLPPAVVEMLAQPLDPALVSQRKGRGSRRFDYIEGHTVIGQANEIFGYGGWGYELAGDVSLRRMESVDTKTGEMRVSYAYSAPVRVTVPGAPSRTDIGFHVVAEDTPEGHETAVKGAVTDGMKRALRSFGDQFGNGLYGDQPPVNARARGQRTQDTAVDEGCGNSGAKADGVEEGGTGNRRNTAQVQQMRERLISLGSEQGFDEAQVRQAVKGQTGKDLDELPARDLKPLVERAARKLQQRQDADTQVAGGER